MKTKTSGNRKASISLNSPLGWVVEFSIDGKLYQKTVVQVLSEAEELMTEFLNDPSTPQLLTE
jgi:hypothetical protein